jgi:hypothetical protein
MIAKTTRSDFDHFSKLRRVLRKAFASPSGHQDPISLLPRTLDGRVQSGIYSMLNFRPIGTASLADLRISILPLILESSLAKGSDLLTLSTHNSESEGIESTLATHTITLQVLRINAVKSLMTLVLLDGGEQDQEMHNIWINGFGEVVHTDENVLCLDSDALQLVSELSPRSWYHITKLHSKDCLYRGNVNPDCEFYSKAQFFPFNYCANGVLPYLM